MKGDSTANKSLVTSAVQKSENLSKEACDCSKNPYNMDIEDKDPGRLLTRAIESMDMPTARKLILEDGIKPSGLAETLMSLIKQAALLNDKPLLQHLFKCPIYIRLGGQVLWSLLDNSEAATTLVLCGCDLNVRKTSNSVVLHVLSASKDPKKLQLAELMIDRGADVRAINHTGNSVLKSAIKGGAPQDFLRKLMLCPKANFMENANVIAASDMSKELMPILVTGSSADDVTRSQRARDAILVLLKNNGPRKMEAIEALLKYDLMPVDAYDRTGYTPLQRAIWKRDAEVAELFLKRGSDPNVRTVQGLLPLWIASTYKESNLAILLIKYGADVHLSNKTGERPIHGACEGKSLSNMLLLIRLGIDVNVVDDGGNTPLSILSINCSYKENIEYSFIVRQLALTAFRGSKINTFYKSLIKKYLATQKLFEACLEELQRMQKMETDEGIPFYTFLIKNVEKTSAFTREDDCRSIFENQGKLKELFPYYFCDLRNAYVFAKEREDLLQDRKELLRDHTFHDKLKNFVLYYHSQTFGSMIWE